MVGSFQWRDTLLNINNMHITFFEIEEWEEKILREKLHKHDLQFFRDTLKPENLAALNECDVLSVFIHSQITREVIASMPQLKLIATRSTGYNHIDLEAANEREVLVSNVPTYGEHTVAEHTFALILALSRNIHKSHVRRLRNNFTIEGLKGFDLQGKTLGVVGTGKIGVHVIQIARAFEMKVVAFDVFPNEELAIKYGYEYLSLNEVLTQSDIISLHAPYVKETYHLINKENIKLVKPGAMLINTSRGELVDNEALLWALDQKILRGCGLDVIEGEELVREEKELLYTNSMSIEKMTELVKDHMLLSRDEVVYTPHIAFFSEEALERILTMTIENIQVFIEGGHHNEVILPKSKMLN